MEYSSNDIKQIFRSIYSLVKHQDELKANVREISHLFSNNFIQNHTKLVAQCKMLIFDDFENVGKKSREILWRKGYYDLITLSKKLASKNSQDEDIEIMKLVENLILEGINYFKIIILRFEKMFNLDLHNIINFKIIQDFDVRFIHEDNLDEQALKNKDDAGDELVGQICTQEISYALETIHAMLISLGDFHRYYIDFNFNGIDNVKQLSAQYYLQAFELNPKNGMTQNQLGTLFAGDNYNIDSIYHYLYSLVCWVPFENSDNNVNKIFQKNVKYLETNEDANGEKLICNDFEVREFVSKLILVIDVFFFDKEITDFTSLCHSVLIDFRKVLNLKKSEGEYYFNEEVILKMISILFFCMFKLNMTNSNKIYSLNAFMVALCSELIESCSSNLETYISDNQKEDSKFQEMYLKMYVQYDNAVKMTQQLSIDKVLAEVKSLSSYEEINSEENDSEEKNLSNKENEIDDMKKAECGVKNKKKNNRRRKRVSSNESDTEDSDCDSDFNIDSETEDDSSISSFDSYDNSSDISDDDVCGLEDIEPEKNQNTDILKLQDPNIEELNHTSNIPNLHERKLSFKKRYSKLNPNIILKFSEKERTLKALKLLFDWLQSNLNILVGCYQSNPEFIHKTMKLLNFFNIDVFSNRYYFERNFITAKLRDDIKGLFEMRRSTPVQEDVSLKMFQIFELAQETLDWEINSKLSVTKDEESFLRIMKMVDFGFLLCKSKKFDYSFCFKDRDFVNQARAVRETKTHGRRIRKRATRNERRKIREHQRIGRGKREGRRRRYRNISAHSIDDGIEIKTPIIITKKGYLKNKNNNIDKSVKADDSDKLSPPETSDDKNGESTKNEIMGKLWLRNEVKSLETKVMNKPANLTLTPYLVLDSKCLSEYTSIVKNLVKMRKFFILIPTSVLSELDELKKYSEGARNAIKWLEYEFSKGNRFLRSQKSHEVLPLPLIKTPKKMDRDAALFLQIVQFCNHIVSTNVENDSSATADIITYLSGDNLNIKKFNNCSYVGILNAIPVKFDQIVNFYSSYKRK